MREAALAGAPRRALAPRTRAARARARRSGGCATSRAGTRGSRAGPRRPTACPRRRGRRATARPAARRGCRQAENRFSWSPARALLEPEQVREARLDPARAPRRRGCTPRARACSFSPRGRGLLVLGDAAAHAHHLGQRPVGDALAVGEAAAAVPERRRAARPSMYFSNSQASRDLPIPAMPMTSTSCARRSSAEAWKSSFTSRSSRSRPTNGASRPAERSAPRDAGDDAQRAPELHRLGLALQLVQRRRPRRRSRPRCARFVDSPTRTVPGSAARLDPRGRVDEVAGDHALALAPSVTAASPVSTPARAPAASGSSSGTAATRSSAARTARSASSSCATGAPQTAMTASPMNFSTVPP